MNNSLNQLPPLGMLKVAALLTNFDHKNTGMKGSLYRFLAVEIHTKM